MDAEDRVVVHAIIAEMSRRWDSFTHTTTQVLIVVLVATAPLLLLLLLCEGRKRRRSTNKVSSLV